MGHDAYRTGASRRKSFPDVKQYTESPSSGWRPNSMDRITTDRILSVPLPVPEGIGRALESTVLPLAEPGRCLRGLGGGTEIVRGSGRADPPRRAEHALRCTAVPPRRGDGPHSSAEGVRRMFPVAGSFRAPGEDRRAARWICDPHRSGTGGDQPALRALRRVGQSIPFI